MTTTQTFGGSFSVQFMPNGDSVSLLTNVYKSVDGEVSAESQELIQRVQEATGEVAPDWTKEPPVLCVELNSLKNSKVVIKTVAWAFDGSRMEFTQGGMTTAFEESTNQKSFWAKRNEDSTKVYLKVARNIASKTVKGCKHITFKVTYQLGASDLEANGTFSINIQEAGQTNYYIDLSASKTKFDKGDDNQVIVVTATPGVGLAPITDMAERKLTVEWLQDDKVVEADPGSNTLKLSVHENEVNGGTFIKARLKDEKGAVLAMSSLGIQDESDDYVLWPTVVPGKSSTVGFSNQQPVNAEWQLGVKKNSDGSLLDNRNVTYSWKVFNGAGEETANSDTLGPGVDKSKVIITPSMCEIGSKSDTPENEKQYGGVNVWVNVSFN